MYMEFNEGEILKLVHKIKKSIINGKGYPAKIEIKNMTGKRIKLKKKQYFALLQSRNQFRLNHGRFPKYTTLNGKSKTPIVLNYQDNKYQCACASFNMAIQGFGDWIDENRIARYFQTTTSGTSPENMITGAKKLGYELTPISRNVNAVSKAKEKGYGVIAHIDTIKASCLGYTGQYGHYVCIARVTKAGNYRVYDPTKGVHSVKPQCIDNAMLNRKINYYQVRPLK